MVSWGMWGEPRHNQHSSKDGCAQERGGKWRQERKAEGKRGAKHSPGLDPPELVLERVREGNKAVVSVTGCLSLLRGLAPRYCQVCAPGAVPEPSLTMAKVKELCLQGAQPLLQMAWGQGPYCSCYLHPTSTRKVGLLWPPTPDQLPACHSQGPTPAPHTGPPAVVVSSPSALQEERLSPQPSPGPGFKGCLASFSSLVNVPSSQRLKLAYRSTRPSPFPVHRGHDISGQIQLKLGNCPCRLFP